MTSPHEIRLRDWMHFADLDGRNKSMFAMNATFLFRGQARADWALVPSFLRIAEEHHLSADTALGLERALLEEFSTGAHLYLPPAVLPKDPRDRVTMWTCMQHYGAPTRLLDWTKSLHVAMYFAVEKEPEYDGAVWIIHPGSIKAAFPLDEVWPREYNDMKLFSSPDAPETLLHVNNNQETERMSAQQTVFTVSPQILARHDPILAQAHTQSEGEPRRERYVKMVVPRELKLDFLSRLHRMNITGRALFPGMDGIGRSMAEMLRLDAAAFEQLSRSEDKGGEA